MKVLKTLTKYETASSQSGGGRKIIQYMFYYVLKVLESVSCKWESDMECSFLRYFVNPQNDVGSFSGAYNLTDD